jgi:hypothetical protein
MPHLNKPIGCGATLLTGATAATLLLLLAPCLPCLSVRLIQQEVEEELSLLSALTHHLDLTHIHSEQHGREMVVLMHHCI